MSEKRIVITGMGTVNPLGHDVEGAWSAILAARSGVGKTDLFEIVGHAGVYRCAGTGGGVTGMGANYGIIDDPIKDDEEAYSPTIRRKLLDWYRGTFYTRLRKDAGILLTMTHWHKNDLAGALYKEAKDNPKADQWTVLFFEGTRTDRENKFDPRQLGEPLWEEFKSTSLVQSLRW